MILYLLIYAIVYLLYWAVKWIIGDARFIWFDMWIGIYVDQGGRRTYFAGLPCFVIIYEWEVH